MSKAIHMRFNLIEASERAGVDQTTVIDFVEREWISPVAGDEFDQEDIARILLILELRNTFGTNDEAIPLILHLMDQLYYLRSRIQRIKK